MTALHVRLLNGLLRYAVPVPNVDTEGLCLVALALAGGGPHPRAAASVLARHLTGRQLKDGSWSAAPNVDTGGAFATALAAITLAQVGTDAERLKLAIESLIRPDCREANWLWRWKLKAVDNKVRSDPSKYGWGWVPETVSWVIPTSFALIALEQGHQTSGRGHGMRARIDLAREMLLDRACPDGGWNAGNAVVYGVPLRPQLDATSVALLALVAMPDAKQVSDALRFLSSTAPNCPSPYSVAWAVLALLLFRETSAQANVAVERTTQQLFSIAEGASDLCARAVCCLAFDAIGGRHVFRTAPR